MITEEDYNAAKKLIKDYEKQQINARKERVLSLKKDDYVKYLGGSYSTNLIEGKSYRLTATPWRDKISIINEKGNRTVTSNWCFKI